MATTEIHAISVTPERALRYVMADKEELLAAKRNINTESAHDIVESNELEYVRFFTLNSFMNCEMENPYNCYKELQDKWQNKRYMNGGRKAKNGREPLMYHIHQSFVGFEVSQEKANEIGRKLAAEVFKGYTVTISTHTNTDNIHNHFIISAWRDDGRKWNDCLTSTREIRRVSDRLCKEYDLHVLDNTQNMRVIRYKDKSGVTRFYEPTDRKNNGIRKREMGEASTDDVNSYRNMPKYSDLCQVKDSNRSTIQNDIDVLLPTCRTYDDLHMNLRKIGYKINDKKKNGDWLKHISYLAPNQEKSTREDKLGDGVYYTREALTTYIDTLATQRDLRAADEEKEKSSEVEYHETYEYGDTDIDSIDVDYRAENGDDGNVIIARTEVEKNVIRDIMVKDSEVKGMINTDGLRRLIAEQKSRKTNGKEYLSKTQEQRLVSQIQDSFRCLIQVEKHGIYSYQQIIDLYASCKSQYEAAVHNYSKAETAISWLKDVLRIPSKISEIDAKIACHHDDVSYIMQEYEEDKTELLEHNARATRYHIDTPCGINDLEGKVTEFERRQSANTAIMSKIVSQMSELENCIKTFDRIDTERGMRNTLMVSQFENLIVSHKQRNEERERNKARER